MVQLPVNGGTTNLSAFEGWELNSIWNNTIAIKGVSNNVEKIDITVDEHNMISVTGITGSHGCRCDEHVVVKKILIK